MPESDTVEALAEQLGVNRRRISKWRAEGAPSSLDHHDWRGWLARTGRRAIAARLPEPATTDAILAAAGQDAPPAAPGVAPAPAGDADAEIAAPGPSASAHDLERFWKARKARADALNAERERQVIDRELVAFAELRTAMGGLAAAAVEVLGQTMWLELRPLFDGLDAGLVRSLRAAHDLAVVKVRDRLAVEIRDRLYAVLTAKPTKPKGS